MGAFGSIIAGVGQAALPYGQQIRSFLEQRRQGLADLLLQQANLSQDPQYRSDLLGHVSDLLGNKDISKVAPAVMRTIQGHAQGDIGLVQLFQQQAPQAPPPPTAGPTLGQVPPGAPGGPDAMQALVVQALAPSPAIPPGSPFQDMVSQATAPVPMAPPAAQPPTSPVSPGAQPQGQLQPTAGVPLAPGATALGSDFSGLMGYLSRTPAGQQRLQPFLSNIAELQRQQQLAGFQLGLGQQRLQLLSSPGVQSQIQELIGRGMDRESAELTVASALGIPVPFGGAMFRAMSQTSTMNLTADQVLRSWPEDAKAAGIKPGSNPVQVILSRYSGQPLQIGEKAFPGRAAVGVDQFGNPVPINVNPYQRGVVQGPPGVTPTTTAMATPRAFPTPSGAPGFVSPFQVAMGRGVQPIPGAVEPFMFPTESQRLVSIPQPGGGIIQAQEPFTTQRLPLTAAGAARAAAASGAAAPQPPAPTPGTGMTFPKVLPEQLTPAGQKDVNDIDTVLTMIDNILKTMDSTGMTNASPVDVYTDYAKYAHGGGQFGEPKYPWAAMSFEGLKSAATALRGNTSRARPIIEKALTHTPSPELSLTNLKAPDTPTLMRKKLTDMRDLLTSAREATVEDMKKSGVIGKTPGTIPVVTNQKEYDALPKGAAYIEDGVRYVKQR